MKSAKFILIVVLVASLFAFSLAACSWDDNGRNIFRVTPQPGERLADHLTATYGAEQFHAQLTAIADSHLAGRGGQP